MSWWALLRAALGWYGDDVDGDTMLLELGPVGGGSDQRTGRLEPLDTRGICGEEAPLPNLADALVGNIVSGAADASIAEVVHRAGANMAAAPDSDARFPREESGDCGMNFLFWTMPSRTSHSRPSSSMRMMRTGT